MGDVKLKPKDHFSGSSPPEIFVGRYGYPNVNTGILAPQIHGDNIIMSMPEKWHEKGLSIAEIIDFRKELIYARFKSHISQSQNLNKLLPIMQEISLADKSVSTEFFLKKPIKMGTKLKLDQHIPFIGNPAPLRNLKLEENPHVNRKVDYISSDTDMLSKDSIKELASHTNTSNIIKILSSGMLGLKKRRKLVPTRWAITAVDDTLSKNLINKIKFYQTIQQIYLFNGNYLGNYYEFLLLPDKFSFEVIEAYFDGSICSQVLKADGKIMNVSGINIATDHEGFNGRKKYAFNVTGAYYTARLAVTEYLEKVKRQAYCIVFREERPEYNAPLGVGILRELSREAFNKKPEKFDTMIEALNQMQTRMNLPINLFKDNSNLLKNYGSQKRLSEWK